MANLLLKKSGYYFRKALPEEVKTLLNRGEIQVSLVTGSKKEAQYKASYLNLSISQAIDCFRIGLNTLEASQLIDDFPYV